jgi:hypothetical protein
LEHPFQAAQAAEVERLAQPAVLGRRAAAAQRVAGHGPVAEPRRAAAHGEAAVAAGPPVVAVEGAAEPQVAAVAAAEPQVVVVVVVAAAPQREAQAAPAAEQPSEAVPSAAAWAFRQDRFRQEAPPARRPRAHSHSARGPRGPRVARR